MNTGFIQKTTHKNRPLFKYFHAPNYIFSRSIKFLLIVILTQHAITWNAVKPVTLLKFAHLIKLFH